MTNNNSWCCRGIIRRSMDDHIVYCEDCGKPLADQPKEGDKLYIVCDYPDGESPDRYEMFLSKHALATFIQTQISEDEHDNPWIEAYVYRMSSKWHYSSPMDKWLDHDTDGDT